MARILIIDDDELIRELLAATVEGMGHSAVRTANLAEARRALLDGPFDVAYLDVRLPDGDGLSALPLLREGDAPPEVIIITGEGDPDGAELATRNGAWDYIRKPCSIERMTLPLTRALQYRAEKRRGRPVALRRDAIVGHGKAISACLDQVAQAAAGRADVLVSGETGTGKELFARAIHDNTPGVTGAFVVVDCAALPENLVESLLFGHAKGAFTGADAPREGLVAQADGGTLFLDEIGELPLAVQAKFLRVLQERRFRPVGSAQERESRFRLVAATNRDLPAMAAQGAFRQDLLYRIRTVSLELPPLRDRREDIGALVFHGLADICGRYGSATKGVTPEFMDALTNHPWPGNVRELLSALEMAVVEAGDESTLFPHHLPVDIRAAVAREAAASPQVPTPGTGTPSHADHGAPPLPTWREFRAQGMADLERRYFTTLMRHTRGDKKRACALSGLKSARFYELLAKLGE